MMVHMGGGNANRGAKQIEDGQKGKRFLPNAIQLKGAMSEISVAVSFLAKPRE